MDKFLASLLCFASMTACTPTATLDIRSESLEPDDTLQAVFEIDLRNEFHPPATNKTVFDLNVSVNGENTQIVLKNLGGPLEGASASLTDNKLSAFTMVLNKDDFEGALMTALDIRKKLQMSGFTANTQGQTASNAPDLNLTNQTIDNGAELIKDLDLSQAVKSALDDVPTNLSKMGLTLFDLKRDSVTFTCDMIGQAPREDLPETLEGYPVRVNCTIAVLNIG